MTTMVWVMLVATWSGSGMPTVFPDEYATKAECLAVADELNREGMPWVRHWIATCVPKHGGVGAEDETGETE